MSRSVPVGLSNLVYTKIIADIAPTTVGGTDGHTDYDTVKKIIGAITANFAPGASNDTLFADDGPFEVASTLGAMSLELNVADLPPDVRADLLGETYGDDGILVSGGDINPPWVAIGMTIKKSNGANRLIWYLKGKFVVPDENNQTKQESINWNTPSITGNFAKRDSDGRWRVACDTDDPKVQTATKTAWFQSPNVGTLAIIGAITPDPAPGVISKATTANITLTCETAGATIEYKLSSSEVWLTYSAGIATSGMSGNVIINVRATKSGMTTAYANLAYTVNA